MHGTYDVKPNTNFISLVTCVFCLNLCVLTRRTFTRLTHQPTCALNKMQFMTSVKFIYISALGEGCLKLQSYALEFTLISQHFNFMLVNFRQFQNFIILVIPIRATQYLDKRLELVFLCYKDSLKMSLQCRNMQEYDIWYKLYSIKLVVVLILSVVLFTPLLADIDISNFCFTHLRILSINFIPVFGLSQRFLLHTQQLRRKEGHNLLNSVNGIFYLTCSFFLRFE